MIDENITYEDFIAGCRTRDYGDLMTQEHHILPRCEGGSDDPGNLIELSIHDHFWAHVIYARETGKCPSGPIYMLHHYRGRTAWNPEEWNEAYAVALELNRNKTISEEQREKLSKAFKGRKLTEEIKRKMSDAHKGMKPSEKCIEAAKAVNTGAKRTDEQIARIREGNMKHGPVSDETRAKLSVAGKGRVLSELHKERIRQAHYGIKPSDESKEKNRQSNLGKKRDEKTKELMSSQKVGRKWFNDGKEQRFIYPDDPRIDAENLKPGQLPNQEKNNKGRIWVNDGKRNYRMKPDDPRIFQYTLGYLSK